MCIAERFRNIAHRLRLDHRRRRQSEHGSASAAAVVNSWNRTWLVHELEFATSKAVQPAVRAIAFTTFQP